MGPLTCKCHGLKNIVLVINHKNNKYRTYKPFANYYISVKKILKLFLISNLFFFTETIMDSSDEKTWVQTFLVSRSSRTESVMSCTTSSNPLIYEGANWGHVYNRIKEILDRCDKCQVSINIKCTVISQPFVTVINVMGTPNLHCWSTC